jgi:hypothetical protein
MSSWDEHLPWLGFKWVHLQVNFVLTIPVLSHPPRSSRHLLLALGCPLGINWRNVHRKCGPISKIELTTSQLDVVHTSEFTRRVTMGSIVPGKTCNKKKRQERDAAHLHVRKKL